MLSDREIRDFAVDLGGVVLLAAVFVGAVLLAAARIEPGGGRPPGLTGSIERVALALPPRAAWLVPLAGVAVLTLVGAAVAAWEPGWRALRVNEEQSAAAYYSSLLLLACAAIALVLSERDQAERKLSWVALAIVFATVGIDEGAELHERIEVRTGLPVALVLAPIGIVAVISAWRVLPSLREVSRGLLLFGLGAGCWLVSQASDPFHAGWKSVVEEGLEMCGSALIFLSLLLVLRRRHAGDSASRRLRSG